MRNSVPTAGLVGLIAAAAAAGLWSAEHLTGQAVFAYLAIPVKVVLFAAPLFFLSDLSGLLHGRPRLAAWLALTLIVATIGSMLAYLPWREAFARRFGNSQYRWYYEGMPSAYPGSHPFSEWQRSWEQRLPHQIEFGLVMVYYVLLISVCTALRLGRMSGAAVAVAGYVLLFLVPLLTGLVLWDYDIFLRGIALDSISMDLTPVIGWLPQDNSIFFYTFMLIFFCICAGFFWAAPRSVSRAEVAVATPKPEVP